jgi:hypothetical protein
MFFIKEKQMYPGEPLADQVDLSPSTPHFLKTVDFVLYWIIQWVEPNITGKIYDEKKTGTRFRITEIKKTYG